MKRLLSLLLVLILVISLATPATANAASTTTYIKSSLKTVTVKQFDSALQKATGKKSTFISASFKIKDTSKAITNLQASQLIYNAYRYKNGKTVSASEKAKYKEIVDNKILKDISKVASANRKYARYAYMWGIMPGTKVADYSNQRNFNATVKVTGKEANDYINRVVNKKVRVGITDLGQVIRTTNLPKNYKDYSYILDSVPNQFYELNYYDETSIWLTNDKNALTKPKDLYKQKTGTANGDLVAFSKIPHYIDTYVQRVIDNVTIRTNYSYKTIGNEWISDLKGTYTRLGSKTDAKYQNEKMLEFVKYAKDNKLTSKGIYVFADKSTTYTYTGTPIVRVHVKVKVGSDLKNFKMRQRDEFKAFGLFYNNGGSSYFYKSFVEDKYYTMILDIPMMPGEAMYDSIDFEPSADALNNYGVINLKGYLAYKKSLR